MELDTLRLTYYCEPGKKPFQSITRLPREDAFRQAAELAKDSKLRKNRFCDADFPGYYALRMQTECWLYDEFRMRGGKPAERHPIYFVLGESDFLNDWFGRGEVFSYPASNLSEADVSFTVGDSMTVFREASPRLYTLGELTRLLCVRDSLESLLREAGPNRMYIETQVWRDGAWEGKQCED